MELALVLLAAILIQKETLAMILILKPSALVRDCDAISVEQCALATPIITNEGTCIGLLS